MTFKEFKIHLRHKIDKLDEELEDRQKVRKFFINNHITFSNDLNRQRFDTIFGLDKITILSTDKKNQEMLLESIEDESHDYKNRARLMSIYINNYLKKPSVKDKEILTYTEKKILEELANG